MERKNKEIENDKNNIQLELNNMIYINENNKKNIESLKIENISLEEKYKNIVEELNNLKNKEQNNEQIEDGEKKEQEKKVMEMLYTNQNNENEIHNDEVSIIKEVKSIEQNENPYINHQTENENYNNQIQVNKISIIKEAKSMEQNENPYANNQIENENNKNEMKNNGLKGGKVVDHENQSQMTSSINNDSQFIYDPNYQPTLIGLSDIGKICYMNSILQCFNHTDIFIFHFLNQSRRIKENDDIKFSKVYLEFIEQLLSIKRSSNTYKLFDPYHIRNEIIHDNSFQNTGPDDIADFIEFFLSKLHEELKTNNNQNNYNNIDINNININENDKNKIFQNIYDYYNNKEKSLIFDIFCGFNEISYKCLNCNNNITYYNYEVFKYIVFSLDEVLNFINNQNGDDENNKISIRDCFNTYFSTEAFNKEKNYYCNNCKSFTKCEYDSKIYTIRDILIIILKRDKDNIVNVEIDFDERINITEYILNDNDSNYLYDLYAVTTCTYQNEEKSRFIASCKIPTDGKWYKYEDTKINEIIDYQEQVVKFETPNLLFYKRDNNYT